MRCPGHVDRKRILRIDARRDHPDIIRNAGSQAHDRELVDVSVRHRDKDTRKRQHEFAGRVELFPRSLPLHDAAAMVGVLFRERPHHVEALHPFRELVNRRLTEAAVPNVRLVSSVMIRCRYRVPARRIVSAAGNSPAADRRAVGPAHDASDVVNAAGEGAVRGDAVADARDGRSIDRRPRRRDDRAAA